MLLLFLISSFGLFWDVFFLSLNFPHFFVETLLLAWNRHDYVGVSLLVEQKKIKKILRIYYKMFIFVCSNNKTRRYIVQSIPASLFTKQPIANLSWTNFYMMRTENKNMELGHWLSWIHSRCRDLMVFLHVPARWVPFL